MAPPTTSRGSIAFFSTYRPLSPLDVYSRPIPPATGKETILTDGKSYNCNGRAVPAAAIKSIIKSQPRSGRPIETSAEDVDGGSATAVVYVSEKADNLETLHLALRCALPGEEDDPVFEVFSAGELFGIPRRVRMEDSGCFAGDRYFIYVSTHEPHARRRQPWTAVYRTDLATGETKRLTPPDVADLSPAVSPSGKRLAVATYQYKVGGWDGAIEDLGTDIVVAGIEGTERRQLCIKNGGWPSWGSDSVLFFHRKVGGYWRVCRAEVGDDGRLDAEEQPVTPEGIDAMTPAGISADTVAVATIRVKSKISTDLSAPSRNPDQYRHIEIFQVGAKDSTKITREARPMADHYSPFAAPGGRIGYHRIRGDGADAARGATPSGSSQKLLSPYKDDVELYRTPGAFPAVSPDGKKLAFIDNDFSTVWVAGEDGKLRVCYKCDGEQVYSPVWSQNKDEDDLYVSKGPAFSFDNVDILAIRDASGDDPGHELLTEGYNNAFPSTDPTGQWMVFRSTRCGGKNKNLYIISAKGGEGDGIMRLTDGPWVDTHCEWSPSGDWIVFSSTRDKKRYADESDHGLDPGYYAVYLVKPKDPAVVMRVRAQQGDAVPRAVRVIASGEDGGGHANHPCFSPDGKSIVFVGDLAAVSADPVSLPLFIHSVRPYGEIFTVDIDTSSIEKNKDVAEFCRITHSRYENSTASWTSFRSGSGSMDDAVWKFIVGGKIDGCPANHTAFCK